ncbi:hypothetical protein C8Q75DRAFT_748299 [Abortiporus biennis]|nr:hypothetical protein C8Q75DRAFT_748299 [Abortiporus biennis]
MSMLLAFHKNILEKIHDPSTNELLLLARGLGMRRIICKLLQIYDSPQSLILLVGASPEEESAIGEELGIMGCKKPGLRIVGFETGKKDRQDLYKKGGLISITSQILTVDMLTSEMPTHLITGILILHAERATPTSPEAFIVRLYREKNKSGFLKAFSDQPEHIISGMSPLRTIMKELQLRTVHIYPRFHQEVIDTLGRDRSSVLQLAIDMTEYMTEIHGAIVQCMTTTLSELKRSNTSLDLDDLNVENAYFRSFDMIVRRQLDTVWHKVGPRTKQLVNDLATLRRLLNYLLSYDALAFHAYLETLIASNTVNDAGNARQNQSPWMLTDAANIIFQYAKRRCYTVTKVAPTVNPQPIHDVDDEDAWAALDEMEGMAAKRPAFPQRAAQRPKWLPDGIEPVLEELPKWSLVAAALQEIEEEMIRRESQLSSRDPGTNTVLIMTSSLRTSQSLNEFLSSMNSDSPPGTEGRKMMESKLRTYFWWKSRLGERKQENKPQGSTHGGPNQNQNQRNNPTSSELGEALKKKDREKQARAASRRRTRGGGPPNAGASRDNPPSAGVPSGPTDGKGPADDSDTIAEFLATQDGDLFLTSVNGGLSQIDFASDFDAFYGLLPAEQTVLIRAYSDDTDELMLAEVQPRYIIMFEPNLDFVRRVEVYKKSNPGLGVRVYLLVYNFSCEEAKYLAGVRREKDAFERLIRERGSMLMPILEERRSESTDSLIKTISSRIAGGRKEINTEPSRVIVDMREFRSSLPSLLHASNLLVVPVTLTVGDYILTPDICVERKSIPDLVSSFNSGRLYTQCELMSVHYKQPILLIEWEEHKSFSLDTVADVKSYAKASNKYPPNKQAAANTDANVSAPTIQSKLVLLTLTFPRVRIIWSSSPYATAQIFNDLKSNNPEPDPLKAITVGAEEDPEVGAGVNTVAEELLRTFPGITSKNVKHVMNKVKSVRELCELSLPAVQEILGVQPGKACYEFIHHGESKR